MNNERFLVRFFQPILAFLFIFSFSHSFGAALPQLTSPVNLSTLSSATPTFTWNTGTNATRYYLELGSTPGGNNYVDSGDLGVSATSYTLTGNTGDVLPTDGSTVYGKLYYDAAWNAIDFQFTASSGGTTGATLPQLTAPVNSSTLSSATPTFTWNTGTDATRYYLELGSTLGGNNYVDSGDLGVSATSYTPTGDTGDVLPTDGSTVYGKLYYDAAWNAIDFQFTASGGGTTGATLPQLTVPVNSSTLSSATPTFTWNTGTDATRYYLELGSTLGGNNYVDSGDLGVSATSYTPTGDTGDVLPTDGSTVYGKLYYDASWNAIDFQFTASGEGVPDTTAPVITIIGDNPLVRKKILYTDVVDLGAYAVDDIDGNVSVDVSYPIAFGNVGSYQVTYTAKDKAGNTATASRTISIIDSDDSPRIFIKGLNPIRIIMGDNYQDAGATAFSNGANFFPDLTVSSSGSVNQNLAGLYEITYSATDSENRTTEAKRYILVQEDFAQTLINSNIPKTGDTQVFYEFDDAYYRAGSERNYTRDDVNEIVTDSINNLIWLDNSDTKNLQATWDEASTYCNSLSVAGNDNWRLPSRLELFFLLDKNRSGRAISDPQIDSSFNNVAPEDYWTKDLSGSVDAVDIDFRRSVISISPKASQNNVRCVSGSEKFKPDFKFETIGNGVGIDVAVDFQNNLMWQDTAEVETNRQKWFSAINYCENLEINGATDWRLPNVNESFSLVSGLIDINGVFEHRHQGGYNGSWFGNGHFWWTSSTSSNEKFEEAHEFYAAASGTWKHYNDLKNNNSNRSDQHVRCVRNYIPPTAKISGGDIAITDGETIEFSGIESTALTSSIVSYEWELVRGSVRTQLSTESTFISNYDFSPGEQTIRLTITDNHGVKISDNINLTVNALPLVADAGSDQSVAFGVPVILDGTNSTGDNAFYNVFYDWYEGENLLGRGETFTLQSLSVGVHTITLKLTAFDFGSTTGIIGTPDTVTINVLPNERPIANAGSDRTVSLNTPITFDGSGSADSDGEIVAYEWIEKPPHGNINNGTLLSTQQSFTKSDFSDGIHVIGLYVTDDKGAKSEVDFIFITVQGEPPTENVPPVAHSFLKYLSEDKLEEIILTGSDANPESTLTFSIVDAPSHGQLSYSRNGGSGIDYIGVIFDYTPNSNYSGSDSFTYKINDGELDSNIATVSLLINQVNDAPIANAGINQTVIEGNSITLDSSNSSDVEGDIASYEWKEGSEVLSTSESFSINSLSVGIHTITLKVTDTEGLTGTDTVKITILETPPPGVNISPVRGNTATYNSVAEFSISLKNQPSNDVVIPVSSSNETEGVPTISELTFTADNWFSPQVVKVEGRNPDVVDGVQNYQIILSSVQSLDLNYHGFDPQDVAMKGLYLHLSPPVQNRDFVSEIQSGFKVPTIYTGHQELTYTLEEYPTGMTISSDGMILWEPALSTEGNTYIVSVSVTDGVKSSEISFNVSVLSTESAMQTIISGRTLRIVDNFECNFIGVNGSEGFSITVPEGSESLLSNVSIYKVNNFTPDLPENTSINSCVFKIKGLPVNGDEYTVTLPAYNLGANKAFEQIGLYSIEQASFDSISSLSEGEKWNGGWSEGQLISENEIRLELKINLLEGLFFIGHKNIETRQNNVQSEADSANSSNYCKKGKLHYNTSLLLPFVEQETELIYDCSSDPENYSARIYNFHALPFEYVNSVETFFEWLLEGKRKIDDLGMDLNSYVAVYVKETKGSLGTAHPFRRLITINPIAAKSRNQIKSTLVHELFHKAQHATLSPIDLYWFGTGLGYEDGRWLLESTATWFSDEVFDNENEYLNQEGTGFKILEAGLNPRHLQRSHPTDAYNRFSFFKLVKERCGPLSIRKLFSRPSIISGTKDIARLTQALDDSCNFGSYLGEDKKSSFEAAMFYYQYATQYRRDIQLLDSNEISDSFPFVLTNYIFADKFTHIDPRTRRINIKASYDMPANSAYSFVLHENLFKLRTEVDGELKCVNEAQGSCITITGDFSQEAVLRLIVPDGEALTVSLLRIPKDEIISDPNDPGGSFGIFPNNHEHYQSNDIYNSEFVLNRNAIPSSKYFVTIINSHDQPVNIDELVFEIRDAKYFRDDVKEVVISRGDGLMWQDNEAAATVQLPLYSVNGNVHTDGDDAIKYCTQTLNNEGFAGYTDWRNPSLNDFFTFWAYEDQYDENGEVLINSHNNNAQRLFAYVETEEYYWTTYSDELFNNGNQYPASRLLGSFKRTLDEITTGIGTLHYVRCVRDIIR